MENNKKLDQIVLKRDTGRHDVVYSGKKNGRGKLCVCVWRGGGEKVDKMGE